MTMLNYYQQNERSLIEQFFQRYPVYHYEVTGISTHQLPYDCIYKSKYNDPPTYVEVKVRSNAYPEYIIEMDKVMKLAPYAKEGTVQYYNFIRTPNDTYDLIIFDLTVRFQIWRKQGPSIIQKRVMNQRTFMLDDPKIEKSVIMIKFDPLLDLRFCNEGWKIGNTIKNQVNIY